MPPSGPAAWGRSPFPLRPVFLLASAREQALWLAGVFSPALGPGQAAIKKQGHEPPLGRPAGGCADAE